MSNSMFADVIELWGEEAQLDVAIEECAELIKAICKHKRGDAFAELRVLEEAVDVTIMIEQLKVMFGVGKFRDIYAKKLAKIKAHIENVKRSKGE